MALTDRLRNLDQKLLPGTREPDEDAESYLRRVAAGRAISPAQAGDVMAALRQYLGVQEGETADESGTRNPTSSSRTSRGTKRATSPRTTPTLTTPTLTTPTLTTPTLTTPGPTSPRSPRTTSNRTPEKSND